MFFDMTHLYSGSCSKLSDRACKNIGNLARFLGTVQSSLKSSSVRVLSVLTKNVNSPGGQDNYSEVGNTTIYTNFLSPEAVYIVRVNIPAEFKNKNTYLLV